MMRSAMTLAALALLASCEQSEEERARDERQWAASNAIVARSEVVRSLREPHEPGRLIYDKPIDLSYATLRKTRPDLDISRSARDEDSVSARMSRDTTRAESRAVPRKSRGRPRM